MNNRARLGDAIHYLPLLAHGYAVVVREGCFETVVTRLGGYAGNGDIGPNRVSAKPVDWLHAECCEGSTIINDAPYSAEPLKGTWHWPDECTRRNSELTQQIG